MSDGRARVNRVRIWLARKILPAGWGPCVTGKANAPRVTGYFDIYGDWHPPEDSNVR